MIYSNKSKTNNQSYIINSIRSYKTLNYIIAGLADFLKSGIPTSEAIELLGIGERSKKHRRSIARLQADYESGTSLGNGLMKEFGIPLALAKMIDDTQADELPIFLSKLSVVFELLIKDKKDFKIVLFYPVVCLLICLLLISMVLLFVVPIFEDMFAQMDAPLPVLTQIVIAIAEVVSTFNFWVIIFLLIAIWTFLLKRFHDFNKVVFFISRKFPVIGPYLSSIDRKIFYNMLIFSLDTSHSISEKTMLLLSFFSGSRYLDKEFSIIYEKISNRTLDLKDIDFKYLYGHQADLAFSKANKGETIRFLYNSLYYYYKKSSEYKRKGLMVALEISSLLLIGIVIGSCVISMYLPIFQMAN